MRRFGVGLCFSLAALVGCAGAARHVEPPPLAPRAVATPVELSPKARCERGEARRLASEYAAAADDFRACDVGATAIDAALGLARVALVSGQNADAVRLARRAEADARTADTARTLAAEALRRSGQIAEARAELAPIAEKPDARAARLLLAELELEVGARRRAEPLLLSIIEDYNEERIAESDGEALALAARAAWLLRSPKDANTLFTAAEHAKPGDPRTLLWRAELFLEKYDPGNAEQLLKELLAKAPHHPEALTLLARVRLDQALDFDEAERLAKSALAVNPELAAAHFVLAGIALRDMELTRAESELAAGLANAPRDLPLLSLRAVVRFLADDAAGFELRKRAVFELNPEYSTFYAILGEYADWEHRYDEIVKLMREALAIDRDDPRALAQLGLNLIRGGQETEGVEQLSRAFSLDPYNVRVYNTLGLYDTLIPKSYVSERSGHFVIRYHKDDRAILSRYVPELLEQAFARMRENYGFTPETPIGVELYAERQSFAVRTSGLPQTAIQGVCFGHTLASMSPQQESFNLGMTLWHELSHVFHIQLSKSRVPRWFTEGLAEYETLVTRPEWSRQHDPELYELLHAGKLPPVVRMSRVFTRAEALSDVATAYYASTKIVEMLASEQGRPKIAAMLQAWGEGRSTEEVFERALGFGTEAADSAFRKREAQMLARYEQQLVPLSRTRAREQLEALARTQPSNADLWVELALARSRSGDAEGASQALARVLAAQPKHAQARFLSARFAAEREQAPRAQELLLGLLKDGSDGFAIQSALGELAQARGDSAAARAAFELAQRWDPTQAEPLLALADIAAKENVPSDELEKLEKLAPLSAHSPGVQRRFLARLLEAGRTADAVRQGESALWADVNGLETHVLFAQALRAAKDVKRARFELESALLCPGEPAALADVHVRLAELLRESGARALAERHFAEARRLDPENARAKAAKH